MYTSLSTDEKINVLTHFSGVIFGLAGSVVFLTSSAHWSSLLFSATFVLLFSASTIYHLTENEEHKKIWRVVDHGSIFVLIAGTYTPFLVKYLDPDQGNLLLMVQWGLVVVGGVLKIFFTGRFKILSMIIYLAMGWVGVLALDQFIEQMPGEVLMWIGIGGGFYTLGVVFYLWKGLKYHHGIWHVFVLGGAISHWWAVWLT